MMDVDPPLILLPGMAADGRLFRHQRAALPCIRTPDWIEPRDCEPLADYAQRFAQAITPGGRCFVGGASFGGIVALEMAAHLQAEACFLVASVRSDRELPWRCGASAGRETRADGFGQDCRLGSPVARPFPAGGRRCSIDAPIQPPVNVSALGELGRPYLATERQDQRSPGLPDPRVGGSHASRATHPPRRGGDGRRPFAPVHAPGGSQRIHSPPTHRAQVTQQRDKRISASAQGNEVTSDTPRAAEMRIPGQAVDSSISREAG